METAAIKKDRGSFLLACIRLAAHNGKLRKEEVVMQELQEVKEVKIVLYKQEQKLLMKQ